MIKLLKNSYIVDVKANKEINFPENTYKCSKTLLTGAPGCGAAFTMKLKFLQDFINNSKKKRFLVIDPAGEFSKMDGITQSFSDDKITCHNFKIEDISVLQGKLDNPFVLYVDNILEENLLTEKIDFVTLLLAFVLKRNLQENEIKRIQKALLDVYRPYILHLRNNNLKYDVKKAPTFDDVAFALRKEDLLLANAFAYTRLFFCQETSPFENKHQIILSDCNLDYILIIFAIQMELLKLSLKITPSKTALYIPKADWLIYDRQPFMVNCHIVKLLDTLSSKYNVDLTMEIADLEIFEQKDVKLLQLFDVHYIFSTPSRHLHGIISTLDLMDSADILKDYILNTYPGTGIRVENKFYTQIETKKK